MTMSDINQTLSTLIGTVNTIVTNCTDAEKLLLATKASSTLLNTTSDNTTYDAIKASIDEINQSILTHGIISDCIDSLFSLYDTLINDSDAIIDIYMIAKSLKGLLENILDSIILIDSEQSMDQINALIKLSESLIESMIAKITSLSAKIDNPQSGFFASKLASDIHSIRSTITDTQTHFQSIEQLNVKLDASINETKNSISSLSSVIDSVSTRLTDTANRLNQLIENKHNPHEVTKTQIGLEHAVIAHKTDDLTTNDSNSVHSAKATNEIWTKANSVTDQVNNNTVVIQKIEPIIKEISNPNLLINGDFTIQERGSDFNGHSHLYLIDRWWVNLHEGGTAIIDIDAPIGLPYSIFVTSSRAIMGQSIELNKVGCELSPNNLYYTLSGWYKGNIEIDPFYPNVIYRDAQFSSNNEVHLKVYGGDKISSSDSWKKFEIVYQSMGINTSNILLYLQIGIKGWLKIAGLKLELGDRATPFVADDLATNLMKCQRYYQTASYHYSPAYHITNPTSTVYLATKMRIPPSISVVSPITAEDNTSYVTNVTPIERDSFRVFPSGIVPRPPSHDPHLHAFFSANAEF